MSKAKDIRSFFGGPPKIVEIPISKAASSIKPSSSNEVVGVDGASAKRKRVASSTDATSSIKSSAAAAAQIDKETKSPSRAAARIETRTAAVKATINDSDEDTPAVICPPKNSSIQLKSSAALSDESDGDVRLSELTSKKLSSTANSTLALPAAVGKPAAKLVAMEAEAFFGAPKVQPPAFISPSIKKELSPPVVVSAAPRSPPKRVRASPAKPVSVSSGDADEGASESESDDSILGGYGAKASKKKVQHAAVAATKPRQIAPASNMPMSTPISAQNAVSSRPAPAVTSAQSSASSSSLTSASKPAIPPPLNLLGDWKMPRGAPGCLKDSAFVMTGDLPHLNRDRVAALIVELGGRTTGGVSGKTTHLLAGNLLEDGREVSTGVKYQTAVKLNTAQPGKIAILNEGQFCDLLHASLPPDQRPVVAPPPPVFSSAPKPTHRTEASSASSAGAASSSAASSHVAQLCSLWVDRHAPADFEHFLGNAKELQALDAWLRGWEATQARVRAEESGGRSKKGSQPPKAALVSGPPGIGKTTAALLLARRYGYDALQMNASDARSQKLLHIAMSGVTDSTVIGSLFGEQAAGAFSGSKHNGKRLIVMDEVDGMSVGDRGGNVELMKIIALSRTPIICICNDREKSTVRSLAGHCLDIRFKRSDRSLLSARMVEVAAVEGLSVERAAMDQLVESCGSDIRQILNTLQMWSVRDNCVKTADMAARLDSLAKDGNLRLDAFSAAPKMFADPKTSPLNVRFEFFFVDYDMIPLIVQQSYPATIDKTNSDAISKLARMSRAAECISDADLMEGYVRGRQAWGLLPSVAASYTRAATFASGPTTVIPFPSWLGKNSSRNKRLRLLSELGVRIASHVSGGREAVRLDYLDALRTACFAPLVNADASGAAVACAETINFLDAYSLSRADMMETMTEVVFKDVGEPISDRVDSKIKAAFTRAYNKASHRSQALSSLDTVTKGSRKQATRKVKVTEDGEEADDTDVDDDGEDDDDSGSGGNDDDSPPLKPLIVKSKAPPKSKAATAVKSKAAAKPRSTAPAKKIITPAASARSRKTMLDDDDDDDSVIEIDLSD